MILFLSAIGVIFGIILLSEGSKNEIDEMLGTGFALVLISGLFGFGMFGNAIGVNTRWEQTTKFTVGKTESAILLESQGVTHEYKDLHSYHLAQEAKYVWIKRNYNSYGNLIGTHVVLNKDDDEE